MNLRDGANYLYDGRTYTWRGMKRALVPFIFQQWLSYGYDTVTGNGVVVGNAENASVISPGNRISRAYNEYSRLVGGYEGLYLEDNTLYSFLHESKEIYLDVVAPEYASIVTYLDHNFYPPDFKNVMNI
jgi:hypothetical protein